MITADIATSSADVESVGRAATAEHGWSVLVERFRQCPRREPTLLTRPDRATRVSTLDV
jgi:hypothetical protein